MAVHCICNICLYYNFLKVDPTLLRSIPVCTKARSILCQVHQLSSFSFEFSLSSSTIEISFKTFFFFAFCLPICGGPVVTSSHTFACFCVEPQKTELTVWQCGLCPACWTCMVLFVLEDVLFVGWLQHDIHSSFKALHFFGASSKKWQDFPSTHAMNSGAFLLCWSVSLGSRGISALRVFMKRGSAQKRKKKKKASRNDPQPLKDIVIHTQQCALDLKIVII